MLKNYLKITWAVMKRRKFYTFISLFGICFTLTTLIVLTALVDHLFSPIYPETKAERTLYVSFTMVHDEKMTSFSYNALSLNYFKKYIEILKTPEKVALACGVREPSVNLYVNNQNIEFTANYTDANFWDIMSFDFIEGKPYTQQNINNNEKLVVLTEQTRDILFGKNEPCTGKNIELNNTFYRVAGVIKGVSSAKILLSGDMYFPFNVLPNDEQKTTDTGGRFSAILLAKDVASVAAVQEEYQSILSKVQIPEERRGSDKRNKFTSLADNNLESTLRCYSMDGLFDKINITPPQLGSRNLIEFKNKLMRYGLIFSLIFMLLPAINLINLINSRIMERASEIGIRKAFGASSSVLTQQFIVENVILTLFGGILSIVLAGLFMHYFNQNDMLAYARLSINWKVLLVAVVCSVVLGLLSGVYPAWRMSKLNVADVIRQSD